MNLLHLIIFDFGFQEGGAAVDPNDYGNLPSIKVPEDPQRLRRLRNRRFRYLAQDS